MSLTGNLEDLPLLDILQIVSFSKKTGYLAIRTVQGEGAIVFKDGFVVSSFAWDTPPIDRRAATLPEDRRRALIRNRIEIALEQLVRLREGQFSFSLTNEPPRTVGPREIAAETLDAGINPQELLLDLARGIDEDRRDSSAALEASFAQPEQPFEDSPIDEAPEHATAPIAPPPVPDEGRTLLLVDDEEDVRRVLAGRLTEAGYQVVEADSPEVGVKKGGRLGRAGINFLLVTDLGMPTSGGSSFHGGFEVVKRLWKMNLHPPILMMTESLSGSLQARARQMGIESFVFKPGLSKLDPQQFHADLRAFAAKIVADVLPRLGHKPVAVSARPQALRPAVAIPRPLADEVSRQFQVLLKRLEELRLPSDATQISILVVKVAREFFERAILFLVKHEEVRGLGGYGPAPKGENINLMVRDVVIPLSESSVFLDVVSARKPFSGPLPDGKWGRYLLGKIGRFKSGAVALMPLLAHRETLAILFGDNPETGRDFDRLESLEVFVNQAGIALENAFLQRKIQFLQGKA